MKLTKLLLVNLTCLLLPQAEATLDAADAAQQLAALQTLTDDTAALTADTTSSNVGANGPTIYENLASVYAQTLNLTSQISDDGDLPSPYGPSDQSLLNASWTPLVSSTGSLLDALTTQRDTLAAVQQPILIYLRYLRNADDVLSSAVSAAASSYESTLTPLSGQLDGEYDAVIALYES